MSLENKLLHSAVSGDDRAFENICVNILPKLLEQQRYRCRRFDIPIDQAADIVQEAFRRAIPQFRSHNIKQFPDHYINKVMLNVTRDWARQRRANRVQELTTELPAKVQDAVTILAIREAFEQLGGTDREILQLVLIEGHSPPEASEKLGIAKWSAYKRFERALHRLRDKLSDMEN